MELKNKIKIGLVLFLIIGLILNIINIQKILQDEFLRESFMCMYGGIFKIIFNIFFTLISLIWIYLSLMFRIDLYKKISKSNSFIDFFRSKTSFKSLKELFNPSHKQDKEYMKRINLLRIFNLVMIILFIIALFIVKSCSFL